MRAACEHCGGAQPLDWQPGHACVHCGKAARIEFRCYWCVTWVPGGGYCRTCGAAVVSHQLFGPARMLKDAGVDRFTIPTMLAGMDPEQRQNLDRIYQRQATIVARHVDDAAFLEQFLFSRTWAGRVEEDLVAQLPWTPPILQKFEQALTPAPDRNLSRAKAIEEATPVELTRSLATIVRLRLDDWDAFDEAFGLCYGDNPALRDEAALAVTGWRVQFGREEPVRFPPDILEQLRRSPHKLAATVRLALLGEKVELPHEAIGSPDKDIAIPAAIIRGDIARLCTALEGDSLEQLAGARTLVRLGNLDPLGRAMTSLNDDVLLAVLDSAVSRGKGSPALRDALFEILETRTHRQIRRKGGLLLCRSCRSEDGLRIMRLADGDSSIVQALLQTAGLPPDRLHEVLVYMIETGGFTMSQYGLSTVAEKGLVGDDFVPRVFDLASDETREQLCRFAEIQLIQRQDEALHIFLNRVAFGPFPALVRKEAWWSLRRVYLRDDPRGENPAALSIEPATRFFGSVGEFALRLSAMLKDPQTIEELWEDLARILREAETAALASDEDAAWSLAGAVVAMMRDSNARFTLRTAGAKYLAAMAAHAPWNSRVGAWVRDLSAPDLDYTLQQMFPMRKPDAANA